MQADYFFLMGLHHFRHFVVNVPWLLYEPKELDASIRQSYDHGHFGGGEDEASSLNGIIPRPNPLILQLLSILFPQPALNSPQRQHILYLILRLPRKLSIGHQRVELLHRVIIARGKHYEILMVKVIQDNLALVVDTLLHLELLQELGFAG